MAWPDRGQFDTEEALLCCARSAEIGTRHDILIVSPIHRGAPGELIQDANDSHTPDTIACTLLLADADREKTLRHIDIESTGQMDGKGRERSEITTSEHADDPGSLLDRQRMVSFPLAKQTLSDDIENQLSDNLDANLKAPPGVVRSQIMNR